MWAGPRTSLTIIAVCVCVRACTRGALARHLTLPRGDPLEDAVCPDSPYEDVQCEPSSLIAAYKTSQQAPGLIIAGQGGSATRVAQVVVEHAGTHAFGILVDGSKDSCASRWGMDWNDVTKIVSTGSVNYTVEQVPYGLRLRLENQVCRTITILQQMTGSSGQPWALKEPYLRLYLPFYTSMVNVKFVHVTRDVRNIHRTHDVDDYYTYLFGDADKTILADDSDSQAVQDIANFTRFAHVWAKIELDLHKTWTSMCPDCYYHLSEIRMTNESTKRTEAKRLAQFLGNPHPDEDTLAKMTSEYHLENLDEDDRKHWDMMQRIVLAPNNNMIREALATFGYEVYRQTPRRPQLS